MSGNEFSQPALSEEMAAKEVEAWLDYKKVKESTRKLYKENIKALAGCLRDGVLARNDDFSFTQKLAFPVGNEGQVKELTHVARMSVAKLQIETSGLTGDPKITATIAALTGKPKNIISALDTEDYNTACSIALFFL